MQKHRLSHPRTLALILGLVVIAFSVVAFWWNSRTQLAPSVETTRDIPEATEFFDETPEQVLEKFIQALEANDPTRAASRDQVRAMQYLQPIVLQQANQYLEL